MTAHRDLPRADRAREAAELRAEGLTYQQIADRMGISRSYANDLLVDPDGSKSATRRKRYCGVCETCGGPTDGSNGRAKAPKQCRACFTTTVVCGTATKYGYGCRCAECTRANREKCYASKAKARGKEPPEHGKTGYTYWGCRCDVCTRANTEFSYGYKRRWDARRRAAA